MTAPEREALAGRARAQAIDLRACNALPRHHRDTQDEIDAAADILDEIAALIEALSNAPAVTVTEGWKPIETAPDDEPILVRYDNDEINLIECDGDGYDWQPYDGKNQSAMGISKPTHWHRLLAFSTTPQPGSQE